jgi:hypothetical protein
MRTLKQSLLNDAKLDLVSDTLAVEQLVRVFLVADLLAAG